MSIWRTELVDSLLIFALLAFCFIVPWVHHQYARFGRWRRWPGLVSAATILYVVALVAFTTFPFPDLSDPDLCTGASLRSYWQTTPLASLSELTSYATEAGWAATLTSGVFLQVFFNVVFFVPLGFLLAYRWRRNLVQALGITLLVTVAIEATQGTGIWGLMPCPYRLADVDDLIANTLGGLLGWSLGRWVGRYLPSPRPVPDPDLDAPTRRRIALANAMDIYTFFFAAALIEVIAFAVGRPIEPGSLALAATALALSLLLFVVIPGLRSDRAGPGIAAANLILISSWRPVPPGLAAMLARWALWWIPMAVFGLLGLAIAVTVDATVAIVRRDRRGLRSLLAGTQYVTQARWRVRASHLPANDD